MKVIQQMKRDAAKMDYENWCVKWSDELQAIYHETGANYDTDYELWLYHRYSTIRIKT